MKKIINIFLVFLIVIFLCQEFKAEETFSPPIPYLRQGLGAKILALGSSGIAILTDSIATYWNPAALAKLIKPEFVGMGATTPFGEQGDSYNYYFLSWANFYSLLGKIQGVLGGNIYYFGSSLYYTKEETEERILDVKYHFFTIPTLSYGWQIRKNFLLGANLKLIYFYAMSMEHTGTSIAVDIGTLWEGFFINRLKLAAVLKNIGPDLEILSWTHKIEGKKGKDPLPHTFTLGIGYDLTKQKKHQLTFVADPYLLWGKGIKSKKISSNTHYIKNTMVTWKNDNPAPGDDWENYVEEYHDPFGWGIRVIPKEGGTKEDFVKKMEEKLIQEGGKYGYWQVGITEKGEVLEGIWKDTIARSYVVGINLGLEYCYNNLLYFRIGRTNFLAETYKVDFFDKATLTYGLGINYRNKYSLDYAYLPWGTGEYHTHIFSLAIKFGKEE